MKINKKRQKLPEICRHFQTLLSRILHWLTMFLFLFLNHYLFSFHYLFFLFPHWLHSLPTFFFVQVTIPQCLGFSHFKMIQIQDLLLLFSKYLIRSSLVTVLITISYMNRFPGSYIFQNVINTFFLFPQQSLWLLLFFNCFCLSYYYTLTVLIQLFKPAYNIVSLKKK